jgi:hypothetical protein
MNILPTRIILILISDKSHMELYDQTPGILRIGKIHLIGSI